MSNPKPALSYQPAPCPRCGARNMEEADQLCRPVEDETGERDCATEFNDGGVSVQPTPESLKAFDDWLDAEAAREGW